MNSTRLKKYLIATPQEESVIGVPMRFRKHLINECVNAMEIGSRVDRVCLLQTFLDTRTDEGKPLDLEYIRAGILLMLQADADFTGTTFQAMTHFLSSDAGAYERMMAEIDSASRKSLLSVPRMFRNASQNRASVCTANSRLLNVRSSVT